MELLRSRRDIIVPKSDDLDAERPAARTTRSGGERSARWGADPSIQDYGRMRSARYDPRVFDRRHRRGMR